MTVENFEQTLIAWFKRNRRDLPWRQEPRDSYRVWVSEIMLQQTQVQRVIPFFNRFIQQFPTVQSLAKASWEEFFPYYQGLGYYSRGRNMLKAAQLVVEQHQGEFPKTAKELKALPGIGEYTAHAIMSFAFNQPVLSFDTNHTRVWGRFLEGSKSAEIDTIQITKQINPKNFKLLNEAIMDFANLVCLNRSPKCDRCPLQNQCVYAQTQGKKEVLASKKQTQFPTKQAQVFLVLHKNNQEYYSSVANKFTPFVLGSEHNTRHAIQAFFTKQYRLALSVRPPFQKQYVQGKPTLFVRAQVQAGQHTFPSFTKRDFQNWLDQFKATVDSA